MTSKNSNKGLILMASKRDGVEVLGISFGVGDRNKGRILPSPKL